MLRCWFVGNEYLVIGIRLLVNSDRRFQKTIQFHFFHPSHPTVLTLPPQLPYRVRWQDLKDLFRRSGTVLRADVALSPDNRSRGHGTRWWVTDLPVALRRYVSRA